MLLTLTRRVRPVALSRTNTASCAGRMVPGTRLVASDWNATYLPSALIAGAPLELLAWAPLLLTLTRRVRPVATSRRNTSSTPLVSPRTRLLAEDVNATYLPSALTAVTAGRKRVPELTLLAWTPALLTFTRIVRGGSAVAWATLKPDPNTTVSRQRQQSERSRIMRGGPIPRVRLLMDPALGSTGWC